MRSLWAWVKTNPIGAAAIALITIVLVVVIFVIFKDAISNQLERFNRWRFDKAVAAEQAEIKRISEENAQLREEMKKAYALGEAKELERDAAYAELEKYGAAAKAAVEAQKVAAEEYEKDKNAIAVDVPLHQRCLDLCRERAELGYGCKPNADTYCARYH